MNILESSCRNCCSRYFYSSTIRNSSFSQHHHRLLLVRLLLCRLTVSSSFHSSRQSKQSSSSSSPCISYRIAVSSTGKTRRFHPLHNVYPFNATRDDAIGGASTLEEENIVLRRRKRPDSGEDAFFVSRVGGLLRPSSSKGNDDGGVAFAVADGVGGWTQSRIDPGDFSHGLCGYMARCALEWNRSAEQLHAVDLLQMGYDRVLEDDGIVAGGSTATVGVGSSDGMVNLAKYFLPGKKRERCPCALLKYIHICIV